MIRFREVVTVTVLLAGLSGVVMAHDGDRSNEGGAVYRVAEPDDDDARNETLEKAHQQLREAVELIRFNRVNDGVEAKVLADTAAWRQVGDRPRLGLVLGPGHENGRDGVLVMGVTPGSSAAEVGLETGDLIVRAGDVNLEGEGAHAVARLVALSRELEEGQSLALDYLHEGELYSVEVEARKLDSSFPGVGSPAMLGWTKPGDFSSYANVIRFPNGWMDLELVSLNDELGEYFNSREGVLVVRGSKDESLGLKGGDVILEIGGRVVKSPEHALRILRSYDAEESFSISIVRHGRSETLSATVPEHDLQPFDLHDFFLHRTEQEDQ